MMMTMVLFFYRSQSVEEAKVYVAMDELCPWSIDMSAAVAWRIEFKRMEIIIYLHGELIFAAPLEHLIKSDECKCTSCRRGMGPGIDVGMRMEMMRPLSSLHCVCLCTCVCVYAARHLDDRSHWRRRWQWS